MSSWTQADLNAIEQAITKSELVVRFRDHQVQYRSMKELLEARAVISAAIRRPKTRYGTSTKGTK